MAKKKNLIEILESYGFEPQKRGIDWWMSCPFHEDRTPSFSISHIQGKYLWHCFSCKRGGSEVQFIQEYEHVGRADAMDKLSRFGYPGLKVDEDRMAITNLIFSLPYAVSLKDRGVSDETLNNYCVKYCKDWYAELAGIGIDPGLASIYLGFEDLSGYNIFPSWDAGGVFAVQIRKPDEKIMRSPHGKWFKRSLYGIENVREDHIFIFEGQIDVLVAASNGIKAIAMGGTRMYEEYWKQLKARNILNVNFVPDADTAGFKFMKDLIGTYPLEFNVTYTALEHGDPDDAILNGSFMNMLGIYPIMWYAKEAGTDLEDLKEIGKVYARLPQLEKAFFRQYLIEEKGEDIAPYLVMDAEADFMAEQIVLANMIASPRVRNEAMKSLTVDHFHSKKHRELFAFIEQQGDKTNPVLVKQVFGDALKDFVDLVNWKGYVETVNRIYLMEQVAKKYRDFKETKDVGRFIEQVYMLSSTEVEVTNSATAINEVVEDVRLKYNNPGAVGIPFGKNFSTINDCLLGYIPSKLVLVSGNAGHGKTTLICNWISDLLTMKVPALFVSLEMNPKEIMEKLVAIRSGIPGPSLMSGSISAQSLKVFEKESESMRDLPFWVVHGAYKIGSLIGLMRAQVIKNHVRVIFLDYLQLVQTGGRRERWEQLMDITSALKTRVCNPLKVTMIAISQLSRGALNQGTPSSIYLSGSYGMLADADVSMAVRKTERGPNGNFIINIDKHRYNADEVVIHAMFDKNRQTIKEL